jgi:hypothetical protein
MRTFTDLGQGQTMPKTDLARTEEKREKAFLALLQFVQECEVVGIPPTKHKREQREKKLMKLALEIELAGQEGLSAEIINDIQTEKLGKCLPKSKPRS